MLKELNKRAEAKGSESQGIETRKRKAGKKYPNQTPIKTQNQTQSPFL